jgi:DNA helicase HerA-like ATPase
MNEEKSEDSRLLGRVTGRDVTELVFRSRKSQDIFLGEMLVGLDEDSGRRFLMRVINIQHGSEARESGWAPRTAGAFMEGDDHDREYTIYDEDRRLYHQVICAPLGYLDGSGDDARFKSPKTIPAHFSKVRHASKEDYRFLERYLGDITVGVLRSGERVISEVPIGADSDFVCQHMGVFATTGMGKSNLMKRLAGSILESGKIGLLVLDPHGEYIDGGKAEAKGLIHHPKAENLKVYATREVECNASDVRISTSEIRVQDMQNLWPFTEPQNEFLNAARARRREEWLDYIVDLEVQEMFEQFKQQFHEGSIGVVKRRAMVLANSKFVVRDPRISMTEMVIGQMHEGEVVLVDLAGASEKEELLISSVLARAVFERNSHLFRDKNAFAKVPPSLIVLEEAQRVFSRAWGGIFQQIAREGRKFKTGLCAISQQPKLIDTEVMSQFNTLIIMGLADRIDRERLTSSARQDISKLDYEIQTLMTGEGLITGPNTPFALPLKVDLYEDYLAGFGKRNNEVKNVDDSFF